MKKIIGTFVSLAFLASAVSAEFKVVAGAGYKKPVSEVLAIYEKNGEKIDGLFGNMQQATTQAKSSDDIKIVIGDEKFLKKSDLGFAGYQKIGQGKLVLCYPQGTKISDAGELKDEKIKKIAIPDFNKAIYGKAAKEFLDNTKMFDSVKNKLYTVATVPQVSAYLVSGEVDAGFLNLTDSIGIQDKIGGCMELPQKDYGEINIVAAQKESCKTDAGCVKFLKFLESEESKAVFTKYGL